MLNVVALSALTAAFAVGCASDGARTPSTSADVVAPAAQGEDRVAEAPDVDRDEGGPAASDASGADADAPVAAAPPAGAAESAVAAEVETAPTEPAEALAATAATAANDEAAPPEPATTSGSDEITTTSDALEAQESSDAPDAPPESDVPVEPAPPVVELPPGYVPGDPTTHPLAIERLRRLSYPGSDLVVVQELPAGANYSRAVATYQSEGLTIRGLLTIPTGERPASGWPVVIFNHGYIPPAQYRTTERYVAYQDAFARAGYITYKSDYRGHGSSEGESGSSRGTPDYTIDVMNAMASVARHPEADANRIGMWGHSMGGLITLKAMVISDRIKAGVIWAGVVASYPDLYNRIGREGQPISNQWNRPGRRSWRVEFVELFGSPEENPAAWAALSPNDHLDRISGPLQLHHGTADSSVTVIQSTRLQEQMEAAGRPSETFIYQGDDHNLSGSLSTALSRSVAFFDQHVKGGG